MGKNRVYRQLKHAKRLSQPLFRVGIVWTLPVLPRANRLLLCIALRTIPGAFLDHIRRIKQRWAEFPRDFPLLPQPPEARPFFSVRGH